MGFLQKNVMISLTKKYGFKKVLLTSSCTDALEMAALLLDFKPGDEVIMPSYTFVSTANAFVLRGAKIVFADSRADHPGIDEDKIADLITSKTKAIVPVHYAGVACDMDKIMSLAKNHNLCVIEDAAQAVDGYYKVRPLGSIGHMAAFSFHETKNVISGEGGMLAINDEKFIKRAEIIREKGTNRSAFFRGEVDKYSWVDIGSSFLPSDIIAAFLFAQLENMEKIQQRRIKIWELYHELLKPLLNSSQVMLPRLPEYATNNAHMYYLVTKTPKLRNQLIAHLNSKSINAIFHYLSLNKSPFYTDKNITQDLYNSDRYTGCLARLPLFYELTESDVKRVAAEVLNFFQP